MAVTHTNPVVIRPEVLAVPAYTQGAAPSNQGFKLSSNENPFPTLPAVQEAVDRVAINRYASPAMPELRADIGRLFGLSEEDSQGAIHLGAGSVSILYQLVQALVGPEDNYVYPWPSFEGYPLLSISTGATPIRVPGTESGEHDLDAMAAAVNDRTRAVLLCTPNNPTGPIIRRDAFDAFMAKIPETVLVVLDEAYRELVTDPEAVKGEEVIHQYPNLVVLRTFSKAYGLAGLRIGYGVGHPDIWNACRVTGIPLSITGQAEAAARASLTPEAQTQLQQQIDELVERRETLVTGLREQGYVVPEAQGNYVWLPLGDAALGLGLKCAEQGILVRAFAGEGVRISVGEAESIPALLQITKEYREGV